MKDTYNEAMAQVYLDEGGYSNDAGDPGGPTKYGITIHDARMYWNPSATADDVKNMPKSVAADIYEKHYATPIHYDDLPPGVDYAILDYGINSGISRAVRVTQGIVGTAQDGVLGPITLAAINKFDPSRLVNAIYAERLSFLQHLRTWSIFGKGWGRRVANGKKLSLFLISKYYKPPIKETKPMNLATINWKTTLAGVTAIFTAVGAFVAAGVYDPAHWSALAAAVAAGVGMIFAKDGNVTNSPTPVQAKTA